MGSDGWAWPTVPLGSVAKFRAGSAFKTEHQGEQSGEIPFIKVSDFSLPENSFEIIGANNWVSRDKARAIKAALHPAGATVFAKIGVALTYNRRRLLVRDTAIDNNLMSAAPIGGRVSAGFLYFLLTYLDFNVIANGSALPYLNVSDLQKLEVGLPPPEEQAAISETLLAIQRRIDLLRQTNTTLESIAQALFKSWFIDFDPVRAKQAGREPEGMDAATAALFPAEFEESAQGLIPKGWRVGVVEDLLILQRGFDLPASQRIEGSFPVLAASGPSGGHHEAMVKGPGVTTGRSGVIGNVYFVHEDFWPLNTSLWVKQFKVATPEFAYQFLRTLDLKRLNAGSAVPTLNRNHVHAQATVLPPSLVVMAYSELAAVLLRRARANKMQIESLTAVRDTLLPRLISGKLRLPEAQEQLEGAFA